MLLFFLLPPPPTPTAFFLPVPHPAALTLAPGSVFDSNGTANKMNGALDHSDQPDPDAIKMFVGQIPRSWSEKELKELFEPYGAVYQINVLRDRSQNPPQSKGTDRMGRGEARGAQVARWASRGAWLHGAGRRAGRAGWERLGPAAPPGSSPRPAGTGGTGARPVQPAPLCRRLIAPVRSLSRQGRLLLGGVAAPPRNSGSQPCCFWSQLFLLLPL